MNPDTPNVLPAMAAAVLRSVLMAGGASLVTAGAMTSSQESDLVGAAIVIVTFAWSLAQKYLANRRLAAANRAPAVPSSTSTPAPAAQTQGA